MTDEVLPELELRWADGSLDLMGWNTGEHGSEFRIETLGEGTDWGNPESVRRVLRSAMLDGSSSVKERDDNRTVQLRLRITGPNGDAPVDAEEPLFLADSRSCELVWRPPNEGVPAAVFVIDSADLRYETNDHAQRKLRWYYTFTLGCLPHTYSPEYVTIEATEAVDLSVRTIFDDCSSLTGWSATGTVLTIEGTPPFQYISLDGVEGETAVVITRTGAVDFSTEPYFTPDTGGISVFFDYPDLRLEVMPAGTGTWITIPQVGVDDGERVYDVGSYAASIDALRFHGLKPDWVLNPIWSVHRLYKQATPYTVEPKQKLLTLEVPGSARTPASLQITMPAGSDAGKVLCYTGPAYNPALSRGSDRPRTPIEGTFSGADDTAAHGETLHYVVPASELPPGAYAIWAHLRAPVGEVAPGTFTVRAEMRDAADTVTLASETLLSTSFGTDNDRILMPLGFTQLPIMALPEGSTALFRLAMDWSIPHDTRWTLGVDEVWAFNVSDGALTILEPGSIANTIWLDSATLDRENPAVFYGASTNKAEAAAASLKSELVAWPGAHAVRPPVTNLFLAAAVASANMAEVTGTFRPAWFLHPGAVS